jgi:hypothetical protein
MILELLGKILARQRKGMTNDINYFDLNWPEVGKKRNEEKAHGRRRDERA